MQWPSHSIARYVVLSIDSAPPAAPMRHLARRAAMDAGSFHRSVTPRAAIFGRMLLYIICTSA